VLLWLKSRGSGSLLAKLQETSNLTTELGQKLDVIAFACHGHRLQSRYISEVKVFGFREDCRQYGNYALVNTSPHCCLNRYFRIAGDPPGMTKTLQKFTGMAAEVAADRGYSSAAGKRVLTCSNGLRIRAVWHNSEGRRRRTIGPSQW
jgi:hypothetical protein